MTLFKVCTLQTTCPDPAFIQLDWSDAIGTTVTVECQGRRWTQQLTAGDGYQASNQRQLTFGLGPSTQIDSLEIRWPSGQRQKFEDLPVDQELLFREGSPRPFPLDKRSSLPAL